MSNTVLHFIDGTNVIVKEPEAAVRALMEQQKMVALTYINGRTATFNTETVKTIESAQGR